MCNHHFFKRFDQVTFFLWRMGCSTFISQMKTETFTIVLVFSKLLSLRKTAYLLRDSSNS